MIYYAGIMRGLPAVRPYKFSGAFIRVHVPRRYSSSWSWRAADVTNLYDFLISWAGVFYVDAFGCDRLTERGGNVYMHLFKRHGRVLNLKYVC